MKSVNIPDIAVARLSLYGRTLALLDQEGVEMVSSATLADICGVNPAQIRKDLAYFGEYGIRGLGYYVNELLYEIRKILGLEKKWPMALVGVGRLGSALLRDTEFTNHGYVFVAAFEKNPKRIGMQVGGLSVSSFEAVMPLVKDKGVKLGVIAVRPTWAQEAADRLVEAGVCGVLNFSPVQLQCPSHVHVENVDLTLKLDVLSFKLTWPTVR
jgi:redox-sensing transcriptional repressor